MAPTTNKPRDSSDLFTNKLDKKSERKIKNEIKRLSKIYEELPENENRLIESLIKRAAFMRISLEKYEEDLKTNGYSEMFTQSIKMDPYERERPAARLYNSMNKNYQSIMKQLGDFLVREPPKEADDGFNDFVGERQ